jgi:hypothetical protein
LVYWGFMLVVHLLVSSSVWLFFALQHTSTNFIHMSGEERQEYIYISHFT